MQLNKLTEEPGTLPKERTKPAAAPKFYLKADTEKERANSPKKRTPDDKKVMCSNSVKRHPRNAHGKVKNNFTNRTPPVFPVHAV